MPVQEEIPPPPKKQGILGFGHSQPQAPDLSGITTDINTVSRRLKMMEESYANIRRFMQVSEENMIAKNKHFSAEIKTLTSEINEMRKDFQELKDKLILVIKELQSVARKEEVKVLEKYINLWNPVKFVGQNEVDNIITEILDKREQQKNKDKGAASSNRKV